MEETLRGGSLSQGRLVVAAVCKGQTTKTTEYTDYNDNLRTFNTFNLPYESNLPSN